ncbi:MAG: hypothetical protein IPK26_14790 [Planctomycetes bacterium]|nr:hypothetical protein [Planctomycetota bacterium]
MFPNAYDSTIANAINWCVTNKNGTGGGAPIRVISTVELTTDVSVVNYGLRIDTASSFY